MILAGPKMLNRRVNWIIASPARCTSGSRPTYSVLSAQQRSVPSAVQLCAPPATVPPRRCFRRHPYASWRRGPTSVATMCNFVDVKDAYVTFWRYVSVAFFWHLEGDYALLYTIFVSVFARLAAHVGESTYGTVLRGQWTVVGMMKGLIKVGYVGSSYCIHPAKVHFLELQIRTVWSHDKTRNYRGRRCVDSA